MMQHARIYLGFDPREAPAFAVAKYSLQRRSSMSVTVKGLHLGLLREQGLYHRPTSIKGGRLFDDISGAPMSTEFAISRFLVPLIQRSGWAMFADSDILALGDVARLFAVIDSSKALMCVKHRHDPPDGSLKMDGQLQLTYQRKNWSSVMLVNCDHAANRALTLEMVNELPGRDLHRFCWLEDDMIGELPGEWNYLVGHTNGIANPRIVHFTDGYPLMPGYEKVEYADRWHADFRNWAVG